VNIFIALLMIALAGLAPGCGKSGHPAHPEAMDVPILMYHHISDDARMEDIQSGVYKVPVKQFNEELACLQQGGYTTVTLDDLVAALYGEATLPMKSVILTFDDGFEDFYTHAYPLLRRYHFRATVYIITQRVGEKGYMTWDQLQELAASPFITLGAHTRTHKLLPELSPQNIREELAGSRSDLENPLGIKVYHLAYPGGHYNDEVIKLARTTGFKTAVTVHFGVKERIDRFYEIPRVAIRGDTSLEKFIKDIKEKGE